MKRLIVGMSGASGTPLAHRFITRVKELSDFEVHLIVTEGARQTAGFESPSAFEDILTLADRVYDNTEIGDSPASGTFRTAGMVIIPCSMKTVAGIATGYADNLLLRSADVTIKEKRPLVLVARETPLSPIHLKNLAYLATLPEISIMAPMLTYYNAPKSIEDMEDHLIGKILDRFDVESPYFTRWTEGDNQ